MTSPEVAPTSAGAPPPVIETVDGRHRWPVAFDRYRLLRAAEPAHWPAGPGGPCVISRYDDVAAVLRDPRTYSSAVAPVPALSLMDPPDHTRVRGTVGRAFTPRAVSEVEPRIVELANEHWAPFLARPGDFVDDYAGRLPVAVVGELLGVPTEDVDQIRAWSHASVRLLGGGGVAVGDRDLAMAMELSRYLLELCERYVAEPAPNVASRLAQFWDQGDLTRDELVGFLQQLFVAGHETTTALLGHGVVALAATPGLLDELRDDDRRVTAFVEEMLRLHAPLQRTFRRSTVDSTIAGEHIPANTLLVVLLGSANRDPAHHHRGDLLDLDAAEANHLAFGQGIHHCIGAPLARLEGRVTFALIAATAAQLRIDEPVPVAVADGPADAYQYPSLALTVAPRGDL